MIEAGTQRQIINRKLDVVVKQDSGSITGMGRILGVNRQQHSNIKEALYKVNVRSISTKG
jgi:hypothetical protein